MRIYPDTLAIGDQDGFLPENDLFKREPLGKGLTNLVSQVEQPLVIAVDGAWGSGKTTFLKTWASELRKQKFPVVFFDAFENDYIDDAFAALARELVELAESHKDKGAKAVATFKEKAVGLGVLLLKGAGKVGAKAAIRLVTNGITDGGNLNDIVKDAASEADSAAEAYMEELLSKPKKQKEIIIEFRKALEALPELLAPTVEGEEQKPLIFIIDELDRCKPLFALALLERIKHFMSVPNVHFVLGVHVRQLEASVRYAYGSETDARLYLQKFINVTQLFQPDVTKNPRVDDYSVYFAHLISSLELPEHGEDGYAFEFIQWFARHYKMSLRAVERVITVMAVSIAYSEKGRLRLAPIIGGLAVMKIINPELYEKARSGKMVWEDFVVFSGGDARNMSFSKMDIDYQWWFYCLTEDDSDEFREFRGRLANFRRLDKKDIIPFLARTAIDVF